MAKTYKCAFKHCKYSPCEIPQGEAVKMGTRYMHMECAKTSVYIQKTKDLYYRKISKTVVMSQLMNVINNIVINKDVDAEYLYFALYYAILNKINIRSPYGLHYIVDNNRIKNEWKIYKSKKIAMEIEKSSSKGERPADNMTAFTYSAKPANTGFGTIFGG
jgi:hypothetical protein